MSEHRPAEYSLRRALLPNPEEVLHAVRARGLSNLADGVDVVARLASRERGILVRATVRAYAASADRALADMLSLVAHSDNEALVAAASRFVADRVRSGAEGLPAMLAGVRMVPGGKKEKN